MYVVRETAVRYGEPATDNFIAFEPTSSWLVLWDDNVGQPDAVAKCWTQANAQMIADALNGV